jgi:hypothetical protein
MLKKDIIPRLLAINSYLSPLKSGVRQRYAGITKEFTNGVHHIPREVFVL